MRYAEIVMAGVLALFSIYLMAKSAELPIGFIRGQGPGGGAWPFWLSAIMLLCCGFIAFNWWRKTSPPAQSEEPFLDGYGWRMVGLVGGGLFAFIISFDAFAVSFMLKGPGTAPLPVQLYDYLRFNFTPEAAAVSTFSILLSVMVIIAADRLVGLRVERF